jgi:hypothetical protein
VSRKNRSHENQENYILTIKKAKTRLKLFLEARERLPDNDPSRNQHNTQLKNGSNPILRVDYYSNNVTLSFHRNNHTVNTMAT